MLVRAMAGNPNVFKLIPNFLTLHADVHRARLQALDAGYLFIRYRYT